MITLITATPGGGKTAYVVGELMLKAQAEGRPIFSMGIPELKIEHSPVPPIDQWTERRQSDEDASVSLPYFLFPENALVVLDEAQRVFRPRANGSQVPDAVQAMETHRHTGIDIVLITQHPGLMDQNVRRLAGRHVHFRDVGILGRYMYEWPEAADPNNWKSAPIKQRYKLPKKAFPLYKSASLHVKRDYTIPPALKVFLGSLLVLGILIFYLFGRIHKRINPSSAADLNLKSVPQAVQQADASNVSPSPPPVQVSPVESLIPKHPDYPESAPIYDGLRSVKAMPIVIGCVSMDNKCKCITQQGTDAGLSQEMCNRRLKNRYFDPYRENVAAVAPTKPDDSRPAVSPVSPATIDSPSAQSNQAPKSPQNPAAANGTAAPGTLPTRGVNG